MDPLTCPDHIHVLHVLPQLGCGGMELALARVVAMEPLAQMRHTVIALRGANCLNGQLPPHVQVHCVQPPGEGASDGVSLPQTARARGLGERLSGRLLPVRLARIVSRLRPTLVHARNWGSWVDCAAAGAMLLGRVPLVYSFHGNSAPPPHTLRRRLGGRLLGAMTTRVFTVSNASRDWLRQEYWLDDGAMAVIPNGVDTQRFFPAEAAPREGRPLVIGTVGNLTTVKNHALLVRACRELRSRGLAVQVRVAGEGPLRTDLQTLIAQLGLRDAFELCGHVSDVPAFLRQLDVFVLPSSSEAHPNALLEAMASGLPCAATSVGGVGQVLQDGACGLLVEKEDVLALTEALEALCRRPQLRRELSVAARRRVCHEYGMEKMAAAYAGLYASVARSKES